jgi:demethylmenaquinone methyltransferase/2-methoxy-6-polyprenyl-1,4-benzoquinol methylase
MTDSQDDALLREQIAYYDARAVEYDRMLRAASRYDRSLAEEHPPLRETLRELAAGADVTEIACGSGQWTRRLAAHARHVTALDASPAMLRIHRERVQAPNVRRLEADVFAWQPERRYDLVFFAFWLSHVPPDRFDHFWTLVGQALRPTGHVLFVDERSWSGSEQYERPLGDERGTTLRQVEDGRQFRMVKVYYGEEALSGRLARLGWRVECSQIDERFYFAVAIAV